MIAPQSLKRVNASLCGMERTTEIGYPTLAAVKMVERTIRKYSQQYGRYQLWKKLPGKMTYRTFRTIVDYLESSNKILIAKDGIVMWTYNPERIRSLQERGLIVR